MEPNQCNKGDLAHGLVHSDFIQLLIGGSQQGRINFYVQATADGDAVHTLFQELYAGLQGCCGSCCLVDLLSRGYMTQLFMIINSIMQTAAMLTSNGLEQVGVVLPAMCLLLDKLAGVCI